jgi:hypothetical protein
LDTKVKEKTSAIFEFIKNNSKTIIIIMSCLKFE